MVLYVVSTPIGNLEDLSPRAIRVLKEASLIACEDTRHTGALLSHLGIKKPLVRYDDHVHHRQAPVLLARLTRGDTVALVSDAGTPGLSDPGARLVADAVKAGIRVVPIPGPSALLGALAASGFPASAFTFLGFLSRRPGRLKRELAAAGTGRTIVFYESVFRVKQSLTLAREVLGNVPAVVARELTKVHEEFIRGDLDSVMSQWVEKKMLKGEVVVLLSPGQSEDKGETE